MKTIINFLIWFWVILGVFTFFSGIYIFISGYMNSQEGFWLDGSFFIAISLVSVVMYFMNKRRMTLYVTNADKHKKK